MAVSSATDVGAMRDDVGRWLVVRRLAFLAFWLGLTFLIAWFPPVNTAVKGDAPSRWDYDGPYTSIARTAPPAASAIATHRPTATVPPPTERPAASMSGHSISGLSSWYAYVPGGAAAGPALRRALGPGWRGKVVTVCASRCIRVTLSDWCGCNTANEKLIDLDRSSFALLADPSRGVVKVTVRWRTSP